MTGLVINFKATLIITEFGKKKQTTVKAHCPACSSQQFCRLNKAGGSVSVHCKACGRHLSVGLLLMEVIAST